MSTLLNYLKEQLQNTPTLAEIQGLEEEDKKQEEEKEEEKVSHIFSSFAELQALLSYVFVECLCILVCSI